MRVLAFVEASSVTGPAKNLIELAQRAAKSSNSEFTVDLRFATFLRDGSSERNEFLRACERGGVQAYGIRERFTFDPLVIRGIREVMATYNPDIVQTHSVKSHFLMKITGTYRRYRWIAFHHGYTWVNLKTQLYNQLDRLSLRSASKVVTVCSAFRVELENRGVAPERITIRHNSVKPFRPPLEGKIVELQRSMRISPGATVLLSIGRLSREKGQVVLVKAFSLIYQKNPKVLLILVGTGPEDHALKRIAKALGVGDLVRFAGQQSDVSPFYSIADLMVLPSQSEGSPNVLLEAMAAGLPIVATAVGGVPEIVTTEREALLVRKNDPVALANAMERLLNDASLRKKISAAAQTTALAYSPEAYCEAIFSLYRNCIAENPDHLA